MWRGYQSHDGALEEGDDVLRFLAGIALVHDVVGPCLQVTFWDDFEWFDLDLQRLLEWRAFADLLQCFEDGLTVELDESGASICYVVVLAVGRSEFHDFLRWNVGQETLVSIDEVLETDEWSLCDSPKEFVDGSNRGFETQVLDPDSVDVVVEWIFADCVLEERAEDVGILGTEHLLGPFDNVEPELDVVGVYLNGALEYSQGVFSVMVLEGVVTENDPVLRVEWEDFEVSANDALGVGLIGLLLEEIEDFQPVRV
jgi:hypothetical protein